MMLATTGTKIASITQQISEGFSLMAQVVTIVFFLKKIATISVSKMQTKHVLEI
jgi:hypothetical protein